MPKGYWIPHLDVHNPEGFQAYRTMADAGHKRFGSRLLARGGRREVVEGHMRARNVLREFNSFDEAMAYYHGPEYARAHPLREPHSACDFLIVEGYDGPQPPPVGTPPAPAALKGYWIVHLDVSDPEGYKPYIAANQMPFGNTARVIWCAPAAAKRWKAASAPAPWCWNFLATRPRSAAIIRPSIRGRRSCATARPRLTSSLSRDTTTNKRNGSETWRRPTGSGTSR